jgi:hypothetical protein
VNSKRKIAFLTVILALALVVGEAAANPIMPSLVEVTSPQNNQVYPQNSVWLNFTVLPFAVIDFNFTSFSYSLDGQTSKPTNGTTFLTDLPAGQHTLAIYGMGGSGYWQGQDMLLDVIYFSVNYSTPWVVFTVVLLATSVPLSVGLFVNRRAVAGRLRRQKTGSFWLGLVCFVFFATFVFGPSTWQLTSKYLFPQYGHGALQISTVPGAIFGLIFMAVGILLMLLGTRQCRVAPTQKGSSNF